jgi:hypothetical protein
MNLHGDWNAFLQSLNFRRVRFLLVGAHAMAVYGRPRFTGDLDVWVARSRTNADRLSRALADFGFADIDPEPFTEFNRILTLGREPVRIDIFTHIPGLVFDPAWRKRTRLRMGDIEVGVLAKGDLIKSKLAAGRPKDLLDIEMLRELEDK